MPSLRFLILAFSCVALSACTSLSYRGCRPGEQFAIQDSLYFGTGKRDGVVTPAERQRFLENTVTPRFPQGLTVWQAAGQWRAADGTNVREMTDVLQLIHPDDPASEKAIGEIVAEYKTAFQQESILRVRDGVCVSF